MVHESNLGFNADPVLLNFGNHVTRTDEDICIQSTINQTTVSQLANYSTNYFSASIDSD